MAAWLAWVFIAVALLALGLPAMTGTWIYDDLNMVNHPLMDGWDDVVAVLWRNSNHYLANEPGQIMFGGATYRPLSMLSLVLFNAAFGFISTPHHVFSLLLHLGAVGALLWMAATKGKVSWPSLLVVAVFAFHPALTEAYYWINGRSDVLAGVALASLAALLSWHDRRRPDTPWRLTWCALGISLVGLSSKSTFLLAALSLLLAWALPSDKAARQPSELLRETSRRLQAMWPAWAALGGGLLSLMVLRRLSLDDQHGSGTPTSALIDLEVISHIPHLLALSAESMLAPWPRSMRLLSWELAQPPSVVHWLIGVLVLVSVFALVTRRRWRVLLLLAGAAGTVAPTVLVSRYFWLGLDRYLYLPMILLCVAFLSAQHSEAEPSPPRPSRRTLAGMALGTSLVLILMVSNTLTASVYSGQKAFVETMVQTRPEDPTGYLMLVRMDLRQGRRDRALDALTILDRQELTPALSHSLASAQLAAGQEGKAIATVEAAFAQHPNNPFVAFDALLLRTAQGRFRDTVELSRRLNMNPITCQATQHQIKSWLKEGALPPEIAQELQTLPAVCHTLSP